MAEDTQKNEAATAAEPPQAVEAVTAEAAAATTAAEVGARNIVPGMVVRVHQKIKETTPKGEERERIQVFEGVVIAKKGKDAKSVTVTVRKVASGVGVERIFPLRLPTIAKIEVVKELRVRRSKLYYLRDFKKRLKEKKPA